MKKFSKLAVLLIILASLVLAAVACDSKPIKIYIADSDMPQTVFVEGQKLNLDTGSLTVEYGKKTDKRGLAADDVTITGYNKDKLGEQTLSISYMGLKTELKITVKERIVVANQELNYFVGENFNNNKGNIRFTDDNGHEELIYFTDVEAEEPKIEITGFDSSAATTAQQVTVICQGFEKKFTVNIFEAEKCTLTSEPARRTYRSHESFDPAGGVFTVWGNNDELRKTFTVTTDMVAEYNPSAVFAKGRGEKITQEVSLKCLGFEKSFQIEITYSDVSYIKNKISDDFSKLAWNSSLPSFSTELGDDAVECALLYFTLTDADKLYFSASEMTSLMRPAATYGLDKWLDSMAAFNHTFLLSSNIYLIAESYDYTKETLNMMEDPNHPANVLAILLSLVKSNFANIAILNNYPATIESALVDVYYIPETDRLSLASGLKRMIDLYEHLMDIPSSWNKNNINTYATKILAAYEIIRLKNPATGRAYLDLYTLRYLNEWRRAETGEADLYDMVYSYIYYHVSSPTERTTMYNNIKESCFPYVLEEMYTYMMDAISEMSAMMPVSSVQPGDVWDTTGFMLYYRNVRRNRDILLSSGDEMLKELYTTLTTSIRFSDGAGGESYGTIEMLWEYVTTGAYGYVYHSNSAFNDPEYMHVWDIYLDMIESGMAIEDYVDTPAFGDDIKTLLQAIMELSPASQFAFFGSIDIDYLDNNKSLDDSLAEEYMFCILDIRDPEWIFNNITEMLYFYYERELGSAGLNVVANLLFGFESFAVCQMADVSMEFPIGYLRDARNAYNQLARAEQLKFLSMLDFLYEKYVGLENPNDSVYARYSGNYSVSNPKSTDLGEWESVFEDLQITINDAMNPLMMMSNISSVLLSKYAYAEILKNKILSSGDAAIIEAYYYELSGIFTLDMQMSMLRQYYVDNIIQLAWYVDGIYTLLYEMYSDELSLFLADASHVIWELLVLSMSAEFGDTDSDTPEPVGDFVAEKVLKAMESFRNLSSDNKELFLMLIDYRYGMFHAGIMQFYTQTVSKNVEDIAMDLILVELVYADYLANPLLIYPEGPLEDGDEISAKNFIIQSITAIEAAIDELDGSETAEFEEYLRDMYDYYYAVYLTLIA